MAMALTKSRNNRRGLFEKLKHWSSCSRAKQLKWRSFRRTEDGCEAEFSGYFQALHSDELRMTLSRRILELVCFIVLAALGWCIYDFVQTSQKPRYDLSWVEAACRERDTNFFITFASEINKPIRGRAPKQICYAANEAAELGAYTVVDFLLSRGADPTLKDSPRGRDLIYALVDSGGCPENLLSKVIEAGSGVKAKDAEGMALIHMAARWSSTNTLATLIRHGADVNAKGREGSTALHSAQSIAHARMLVAAGASAAVTNYAGITPPQMANANKHPDVADYLSSLTVGDRTE